MAEVDQPADAGAGPEVDVAADDPEVVIGSADSDAKDQPEEPHAAYSQHTTVNINRAGSQQQEDVRRVLAAMGPLDRTEVDTALRSNPRRAIDSKLAVALETNKLVTLVGGVGSGRRNGALTAIAALVGRDAIVQLGLGQGHSLSAVPFKPGFGYLLDASSDPDPQQSLEAARLRAVQSGLSEMGAYLVVLGLRESNWTGVDSRFDFDWQPPKLDELVAAWSLEPPVDLDDPAIAAVLNDDLTVTQNVAMMQRLAAAAESGVSYRQAASQMPEAHRDEIRSWARSISDANQWALAAALAFFSGIPQRSFETLFESLQEIVRARVSGRDEDTPEGPNSLQSAYRELEDCRAEVRQRTTKYAHISTPVSRSHVVLKNEAATSIYLQEFWRSSPHQIRDSVREWLGECWAVDDVDVSRTMGERLATLGSSDADMWFEVVQGWASTPVPMANMQAAVAVDAAITHGEPRVGALASAVVAQWAEAPKRQLPLRTASLYAYAGLEGVFRIPHALSVYRRVLRDNPDLQVFIADAWLRFSKNCLTSPDLASELTSAVISLKPVGVREPSLHDPTDPIFRLMELWFEESAESPPLALEVAQFEQPRRQLAQAIAALLRHSYRECKWLVEIAPWCDTTSDSIADAALKLIGAALLGIAEPAKAGHGDARQALDVIEEFRSDLGRSRQRPDGPTALAVQRVEKVCDLVWTHIERNVYA